MRAAILKELGAPLVVERVTPLSPSEHRAIVRTTAAPLCSTDCLNAAGRLGKVPPLILGHAAAGVVEEVGSGVVGIAVGQRVVVPGTPECGVCFYCALGRPDQCSELFDAPAFPHVAHLDDGRPVAASGNVGAYAEFLNVSINQVFPVESDLPDEQLSLLGCGVTSGLGAIFNVAQVRAGSSVAVVGCGHLGLWMIQGARVAGASRIIAVEPRLERRALAMQLGATDVVDPGTGDAVEQVRDMTHRRGVDYCLEAAGPAVAQALAFELTRRAGTVVLTGVEFLGKTVTLPQVPFALHGKAVHSCQNGRVRMRRDLPRFIAMMEDGLVDAASIITGRYGLDEINDALRAAAEHADLSGVVLPGQASPSETTRLEHQGSVRA